MKRRFVKAHYLRIVVIAIALMSMVSGRAFAEARIFNIPAEVAARAIPEFARQAGIQIIAPTEKLRGFHLNPVQGKYDVHEALEILLAGSGLIVAADDGKLIVLREDAQRTGKI